MAWWEQTVGVVVGGLLTTVTNVWLEKWRTRKGQTESLRVAYVEFMACAESILGTAGNMKDLHERRLMADTRLKIAEKSAERRALAQKVWDSIPQAESEDSYEWAALGTTDPNPDWPPFREAMRALQERLRRDLLD
jgi:hypothetical protein